MSFWPSSVATDANLSIAVNSTQTTLGAPAGSSDVTLTLVSTTGFPTAGFVTIDSEVIQYTGVSAGTLTGCTRGADGTSSAAHSNGAAVSCTIVANHHNSLKDETKAIETTLSGLTGLSPTLPLTSSKVMVTDGSGHLAVSSVTPTTLAFLDATSSVQTQINTKAPTASPTFTGTVTTAGIAMGATKITGLANGTAATDAAAFGQIKVLQNILATNTTDFTTTSTTYVTTNISATITPTSASSRIKISFSGMARYDVNSEYALTVANGTTDLSVGANGFARITSSATGTSRMPVSFVYIDSPATTSAVTYNIRIKNVNGTTTIGLGGSTTQVMILEEIV